MTEMRIVGTIEVTEVLFGEDVYQRQVEVGRFGAIWLICDATAWMFVGESKQSQLESRWQEMVNPEPEPWTDEEQQEALCEQMASDDYENTFYL
jgi:hypothetical protein